MRATTPSHTSTRLWAGRIVSGAAALFLLVDGLMKLAKPAAVVEATVRLGYPESVIVGLWAGLVLRDDRLRVVIVEPN